MIFTKGFKNVWYSSLFHYNIHFPVQRSVGEGREGTFKRVFNLRGQYIEFLVGRGEFKEFLVGRGEFKEFLVARGEFKEFLVGEGRI